jgi:hypothetical protein
MKTQNYNATNPRIFNFKHLNNYQLTIPYVQIAVVFFLLNLGLSFECLGQSPGVFNFGNYADCDVQVTIYAYDGECGGIDCDCPVASYGPVTVYVNSTVNVASGYSGGGDVWGKVLVVYFSSSSSNGSSTCSASGTSISCTGSPSVQWDSCNGAHIP